MGIRAALLGGCIACLAQGPGVVGNVIDEAEPKLVALAESVGVCDIPEDVRDHAPSLDSVKVGLSDRVVPNVKAVSLPRTKNSDALRCWRGGRPKVDRSSLNFKGRMRNCAKSWRTAAVGEINSNGGFLAGLQLDSVLNTSNDPWPFRYRQRCSAEVQTLSREFVAFLRQRQCGPSLGTTQLQRFGGQVVAPAGFGQAIDGILARRFGQLDAAAGKIHGLARLLPKPPRHERVGDGRAGDYQSEKRDRREPRSGDPRSPSAAAAGCALLLLALLLAPVFSFGVQTHRYWLALLALILACVLVWHACIVAFVP